MSNFLAELMANAPDTAQTVLIEKDYVLGAYKAIDPDKAKAVTEPAAVEALAAADKAGQFDALAKMALFPTFMLICYIIMFFYFQSKGGYKAVELGGGQHEVDGADEAIADGAIAGGEA